MKALLGLAIFPLICIGITILTVVLIIFALRRRTQTINQQLQEKVEVTENGTPTNTRWARGDLKSAPKSHKTRETMKLCPACGGENPTGTSICAYCRSAL
jgi:hypothetical protein